MRPTFLAIAACLAIVAGCTSPSPTTSPQVSPSSSGPLPSSGVASPSGVAASPSPAASPAAFAIRTKPRPAGPNEVCGGVGLDRYFLHGDPTDGRVAWLVSTAGTPAKNIVWPFGYTARFNPMLEILDATGVMVIREGAPVTGVCDVNPDGSVYLVPPFR